MVRSLFAAAALTALLVAGTPASAAEADALLPNDTEMVMSFNLKQVLDSAIIKKYALEEMKKAIKGDKDVSKYLADLGLDPLTDFERVTLAVTAEGPEKAFIVVRGKFDKAKIEAKAAEEAKKDGAKLKISKEVEGMVYEIPGQNNQPMFAAIADGSTIVAASEKKPLLAALAKASGKNKTMLKKEMIDLLTKVDDSQSMYMVMVTKGVTGNTPLPIDDKTKETLDKITAVTGNLNVTKDVKLSFNLSVKDKDTAKEISKLIDDGLANLKGLAPILTAQDKRLSPLVDLINSIKVTTQGASITLTGDVSGNAIDKAFKGD